ncbi:uncharacterized protein At3g27210-like [Cornus florida]|uniref:uncharacterized protein At3g27210-like n=1 Tax=Cornus florida TaxID=4283 RepID=UPI00289B6532|nr:uncharacterized protein At3g27210-like [Cornus florida]
MGTCASVLKDPNSSTKIRRPFRTKTEKVVIQSPTKVKPIVNGDRPTAEFGPNSQPYQPVSNFHDFGSKEETFFDSQPWLDSDCEDDFLSVNGDFTPSRGSTPVHQSFSMGTPRRSFLEDRTPGSKPEPSSTGKRMKLSELLEKSLEGDENVKMEGQTAMLELFQKDANVTPRDSGANSVSSIKKTPSGHLKAEKEKSVRSAECCIPSLLSSRSFSERRKKKKNPVHSFQ